MHLTAERARADVAFKRAIIELHEDPHECSTYDGNCTWVPNGDCSTLRLLARSYIAAGRPGFDPAWRTGD